MPFGIPCPEDDLASAASLMDANNTRMQNLVYNIIFPIGQMITFNEKLIGMTHTSLKRKVKSIVNKGTNAITPVIEAIASKVMEMLNCNAATLAGVQAAIALAPAGETPDIPASDIRNPAWPEPSGNTAVIVQNTVRQANEDINSLLHLLYLLGVTPAQVRRYLEIGTIPPVYLCPKPEAHTIEEISPPPEAVAATPETNPSVFVPLDQPVPQRQVLGLFEE